MKEREVKKIIVRLANVVYHLADNLENDMTHWHIDDAKAELKVIGALLDEKVDGEY